MVGVAGVVSAGTATTTIQQSNIRGLQMNIKSEKQVKNMDKLLSLMKNNVTVLKKGKNQISLKQDKVNQATAQHAETTVPNLFRLKDTSVTPSPQLVAVPLASNAASNTLDAHAVDSSKKNSPFIENQQQLARHTSRENQYRALREGQQQIQGVDTGASNEVIVQKNGEAGAAGLRVGGRFR